MKQYLDLLHRVLNTGVRQKNRTNIDTLMLPGAMLQFDLRDGFPAVTTKKLAFKTMVGELIGFLNGYTNAAQFRELGCNIWDLNANKNEDWLANPNRKGEDDLGRIYGAQWTDWITYSLYEHNRGEVRDLNDFGGDSCDVAIGSINQVYSVLHKLYHNPTDRRMIISGWNPAELDKMALPPCHLLYQFIADQENNLLHLCMYQRSCDLFLGVPFNIASAATFLTIMAKLSGYDVGIYTHFLADAHIYVNHIDQVMEQLYRTPYDLPTLEYSGPTFEGVLYNSSVFSQLKPSHFTLIGYQHHDPIKAEMAV